MENLLLLGEVSSEVVAAAAGFGFGLLAGIGIFWWPIFVIAMLIESLFLTRSSSEEKFGVAAFFTLLVLLTLHIFGVFDVITFVRGNWETIIYVALGYFAFGLLVYAPLRGWLTVRKHRDEYVEKLRREKEHWMSRSYVEDGQKALSHEEKEELWKTKIKAEKWAEIKSVNNDQSKVFDWTVFWALDFTGKFIFQWLARLEDLFNLCWRAIRGVAQSIKDSALKGADTDV